MDLSLKHRNREGTRKGQSCRGDLELHSYVVETQDVFLAMKTIADNRLCIRDPGNRQQSNGVVDKGTFL